VLRADGSDAVLKVVLPGTDVAGHASAFRAGDGQGHVRLLEAEPALGALLLERPGSSVDHLGLTAEVQLDALAATLTVAWPGVHRTGRRRTGPGRWPAASGPATRSSRAWSGQRWSCRPWPAPRC